MTTGRTIFENDSPLFIPDPNRQKTAQSTPSVIAPELGTIRQIYSSLPEQSGIKAITKSVQQTSFQPLTESLGNVAQQLRTPEGVMGVVNPDLEAFPLTTKFLEYAKNKAFLSKQEITDFARRPELKRGEADMLNNLAKDLPEGKIPAQEFTDSVKQELLPLEAVKVASPQFSGTTIARTTEGDVPYRIGRGSGKYSEGGRNYEEVVFESPITTNGSSHYPNSKNYFAHARGDEVVEGGKKIWREQEIQSDLLQKDNLERLRRDVFRHGQHDNESFGEIARRIGQGNEIVGNNRIVEMNTKELSPLDPFINDRFGERIMRERIKQKAQQGYSSYRIPTGETIGKIEGFESSRFQSVKENGFAGELIKPEQLKIGQEVYRGGGAIVRGRLPEHDRWIITDILGDGRFKAVPKSFFENQKQLSSTENELLNKKFGEIPETLKETFDLTGKSNPQYSRYEKWGKFLKNKYGSKEITDPQGNTWVDVPLKKEYARMPIEAFGAVAVPASIFKSRITHQSNQKEEPLFISK